VSGSNPAHLIIKETAISNEPVIGRVSAVSRKPVTGGIPAASVEPVISVFPDSPGFSPGCGGS